jgi:tetratricopeptide (TPR) repeat protein
VKRIRRNHLIAAACLALACASAAAPHHPEPRLEVVSRRIADDPENVELRLERGSLRLVLDRPRSAVADFEHARRLAPGDERVAFALGAALIRSGRPADGLALLDELLAARPAHGPAHLARASALEKLDRPLQAARAYAAAIELLPSPQPDHYRSCAAAFAAAGLVDEGVAMLDDAVARLGPIVSLELAAIDLETARERWDAAIERIDRMRGTARRKERWLALRAETLLRAGCSCAPADRRRPAPTTSGRSPRSIVCRPGIV